MNAIQHTAIGAGFAALIYISFATLGIMLDVITIGISITIGGLAPDMIERPGKSTHRDKYHSRNALKYSGAVALLMFPLLFLFNQSFVLGIFFFISGYFLHLFVDGFTAAGLKEFPIGHRLGPKNKITQKQINYILDLNPSYKNRMHEFEGMSTIDASRIIEKLRRI